jgi:hypothetical protein
MKKKQSKRNTKNFRKSVKKKQQKPVRVLTSMFQKTNPFDKFHAIFVPSMRIEDSEPVKFVKSIKSLSDDVQNDIVNHLEKYPIIEKGCYTNGTLLSLNVPYLNTVQGFYGNTIESEFGPTGDNSTPVLYNELLESCSTSDSKYLYITESIVLDTEKKIIWYRHCWNEIEEKHIDMTVEVQRLNQVGFERFMYYRACEIYPTSSSPVFENLKDRNLTQYIYNLQEGARYSFPK